MAADVFALNTKSDPNPLTPIEASFAGLPLLLSSRAGNAAELVREGVTGLTIKDPFEPAPELAEILSLPLGDIRTMGAHARANAEAKFTRRAAAEAFLSSVFGNPNDLRA
jgi:glycosyltransferase involved in cell wall biosynthesis